MQSNNLPFKAVFTDLDGTLLQRTSKISKANLKACNDLMALGVPIIFTTGRDISSCKKLIKKYGFDKYPSYCITLCGGIIYKIPEMEICHKTPISIDLINKFLESSHKKQIVLTMYTENNILICKNKLLYRIINRIFSSSRMKIRGYNIDKQTSHLLNPNYEVYKLLTYYPTSILNANAHLEKVELLEKEFINELEIYKSSPLFSEVLPLNTNKGNAVVFITKKLGFKPEEVVYLGDSHNDVSAFSKPFYKVALGNAIPKLIQDADFVSSKCKEDGFAFAINMIFFNDKNQPKNN